MNIKVETHRLFTVTLSEEEARDAVIDPSPLATALLDQLDEKGAARRTPRKKMPRGKPASRTSRSARRARKPMRRLRCDTCGEDVPAVAWNRHQAKHEKSQSA